MVTLNRLGKPLLCTAFSLPVVLLALFLGLVSATAVRGDDKSDRERRVKVAIALAGTDFKGSATPAAVAVAPPPRLQQPKPYAVGYAKSVGEHIPLVVYVGCTGPRIEGAATVRTDSYPGVTAPAVVVGYPQGDRLIQDKTLPATATPDEIAKATKDATKKIAEPMPKDKPTAPPPLNWMIGSYPAPV